MSEGARNKTDLVHHIISKRMQLRLRYVSKTIQ